MPHSTLHPWHAAPYMACSWHLTNDECVSEVVKCPKEEAGL